ncbi:VPS10 domain-containing protein [Elongatibacter sediminis]|uniref:Sortilin N-terminal domain-containing protein n=1 Tax=Elongatibacter sediminis TaxID=3119006 RepID=A0AAW9R6T4_9GAMM
MIQRIHVLLATICLLSGAGAALAAEHEPGLNATTFEGLEWRGIGPALMSGRIADIAVDPEDRSTWYIGVGSGGVWKTDNRGVTWTSIFDGQGSYSIGCVTLDPNNPNTVWVGTGENVSGRHVAYGDGVYRSRDGGQTWENLGLENSEHIGMIRVDPRDSDVVYVAAQGPLWSGGGDRGLFKTTDGGQTWENILSGGPYTGVNEVHLDPRNPDVIFAVKHQRLRNVAALVNGGPESGIFKSADGGLTWRELTTGLPDEDMGKIGLAISPIDPDVVYATIELGARSGGFWRSEDGGESWEKRSDYLSGGTGPHYYQEIFADPHRFDRIYQMDATLYISSDGGTTFEPQPYGYKHGDHHAVAFDPDDPDWVLIGTDGGLYESHDNGATWRFMANLPVTQFYKVAVDYDEPFYNLYGGTQDNNTQGGPSRTDNIHGIRNEDWFITVFADGHQPAVDPTNPDIIYSEWQEGNLVRYDRVSGEIVYIQPQPEADEDTERFNWDAPILISPHDPARLYYASYRVWRSDDRGDSWRTVSGDLSHGRDRLNAPMMGRVWSIDAPWDLYAMSEYGTVTSLSESPRIEGLLYAGTDDGRIQVSEDGGENWRAIDRLPDTPNGFFVNDIKADLHDPDTVYAVVDDHKSGDFTPYVLRSRDRGRTWVSITSNLPERTVVWRLVQDHVNPDLLFLGTETGVYFTLDGGQRWTPLSGNFPTISVRDLAIQKRENDLVAATFGRGFWILDDYTPLRNLNADDLQRDGMLFPVRDAWWYLPKLPLGDFAEGGKSSQGDSYFIAPNPPFGAVFTYYLRDDLLSTREQRQQREKELAEAGEDTPYPGWEALRAEEVEEASAIVLTVRDSEGRIVRRIEGPATAGFHRVAWDLRYPLSEPWTAETGGHNYIEIPGPLAVPGRYTVALASRINGRLTELAPEQAFEVKPLRERGLEGAAPAEMVAFTRQLDAMNRQVEGATRAVTDYLQETGAIKQTLLRSSAPEALRDQARGLELELLDIQQTLTGNTRRGLYGDTGPVSISRRLEVATMGTFRSTYGPTPTHRRSLEIGESQFAPLRDRLDAIGDRELPALRQALDAAGVPWTPGRSVPAGS